MNKQTEALKMAEEALELLRKAWHEIGIYDAMYDNLVLSIQACKEALEQPAQVIINDDKNATGSQFYCAKVMMQQPAQEPVAIVMPIYDDDPQWNDVIDCYLPPNTPLYTHPAPSCKCDECGMKYCECGERK